MGPARRAGSQIPKRVIVPAMYAREPLLPPPGGPLVRPPYLGMESHRSSIPKVIGILAIVFASLGLLGSLAMTFGFDEEMQKYAVTREQLGGFGTWMLVYLIIGVALFGAHLTAGIASVRYAASAPSWMTFYAIAAIALVVADVAVPIATFPSGSGFLHKAMYEDFVYPRIGLAILALPWPIIALVMMNQRSARLACAAQPS